MIKWAKPQIEKVIKDKEKQKQYIDILEEFMEEQRDILSIFNLFKKYDFSKEDCYRICRLLTWKKIIHFAQNLLLLYAILLQLQLKELLVSKLITYRFYNNLLY